MRSPRRHLLLAAIAALLLLVAPGSAAAATQGCAADTTGVSDLTASWEQDLLALTNAHRTGMGLVALQLDATLTTASAWKARDMARRDYFSHDDPANGDAPARSPWDRLTACGWTTGGSRAENIAAGYDTPKEVIDGWIASPGHRANIENGALRFVGFGVATSSSSRYGHYEVQMFSSVAGPTAPTPVAPTPPVDDDGTVDPGTDTEDGTRTPTALEARLQGVRVTIGRVRCRGARAVNGWCWRAITTGSIRTVAGEGVAATPVTLTRHSRAARGFVHAGRAVSTGTGAFRVVAPLAAPRRGTAAWLLREARLWNVDAGVATARVVARR